MLHPLNIGNIAPNTVIADFMIQPSLATRMATMGRAYQRVKYANLTFRVTTQCPSLLGGGYVAGFIRDAADIIPSEQPAAFLIRNTGAKVVPWWVPSTVRPRILQKWFYTEKPEIGADAVREYSPGRFVIVADSIGNSTNQQGFISVELDWTIVLTDATFREEAAATPPTVSFVAPATLYGSATDIQYLDVNNNFANLLKSTVPGLPEYIRMPNTTLVINPSGVFPVDVWCGIGSDHYRPTHYDPKTKVYVFIVSPQILNTKIADAGDIIRVVTSSGDSVPVVSAAHQLSLANMTIQDDDYEPQASNCRPVPMCSRTTSPQRMTLGSGEQ